MTLASTHASSHITPRSGAAAARQLTKNDALFRNLFMEGFTKNKFPKFNEDHFRDLPCDGEYDEEVTRRNEDD